MWYGCNKCCGQSRARQGGLGEAPRGRCLGVSVFTVLNWWIMSLLPIGNTELGSYLPQPFKQTSYYRMSSLYLKMLETSFSDFGMFICQFKRPNLKIWNLKWPNGQKFRFWSISDFRALHFWNFQIRATGLLGLSMTLFDVVSCLKISCTVYMYIDHVRFLNTELMANEAYLTFLFSVQGIITTSCT